jgi:hypothetical protein
LKIFAEWPKDWDAAFTLLARGAFVITTAQKDGQVPLVEVVSRAGGSLKLVNPWTGDVSVYRDGRKAEDVSGRVLSVSTTKGETLVLAPKASVGPPHRIAL